MSAWRAELSKAEEGCRSFVEGMVRKIQPLHKNAGDAYWNASGSGKVEDYDAYARCQIEEKKIYTDRDAFAQLESYRESADIIDPLLRRQIEILRNKFLPNQVDPGLIEEMIQLGSRIEASFNTFRGTYQSAKVSNNDLLDVLRNSNDSLLRKEAWEAFKRVGEIVSDPMIDLVKLRNQGARELGFRDYYALMMEAEEHDEAAILKLFDELTELTDEPFRLAKADLDEELASRFGVSIEEIRPWHYGDFFFQESPEGVNSELNRYLTSRNIREMVEGFYEGIGLDVSGVLDRSDLYEREGKYQHAYCIDIDRSGDVRTMMNLRENLRSVSTMLHELGHGVYYVCVDASLPFLLRNDAHTLCTEAIALMFERNVNDPAWLETVVGVPRKETDRLFPLIKAQRRLGKLVFCRWSQVMFRFERELYRDPDQDLSGLWWDLKERYQFLKGPENRNAPDWAAKIHFTSSPVYYHNYLLGDLLASQLVNALSDKVDQNYRSRGVGFVNQKAVGEFLKEKVFAPGKRLPWNEMIRQATGEPLSAGFFVDEFVKES